MKDFIKEVESLDFSHDTRYGCWKTNLLSDVKQKRCDMSESLYDAIYGGNMFLGDDGTDRLYALYFLLGDKDEQICDDVPYERFIKMVLHYSLQGNDTEARKNISLILNGSCPPADILYVLEKGYGANHPLARFIGGFKTLDEDTDTNGKNKSQNRKPAPTKQTRQFITRVVEILCIRGVCKRMEGQTKVKFLFPASYYNELADLIVKSAYENKNRVDWELMEEYFTHDFKVDTAKKKKLPDELNIDEKRKRIKICKCVEEARNYKGGV